MNDKITCETFLDYYYKCENLRENSDNCHNYKDIFDNCLNSCKSDINNCRNFLKKNKSKLYTMNIFLSDK